jgi:hypothetical protein
LHAHKLEIFLNAGMDVPRRSQAGSHHAAQRETADALCR